MVTQFAEKLFDKANGPGHASSTVLAGECLLHARPFARDYDEGNLTGARAVTEETIVKVDFGYFLLRSVIDLLWSPSSVRVVSRL